MQNACNQDEIAIGEMSKGPLRLVLKLLMEIMLGDRRKN